ncbi:PREDICTED: uncharacterized protein LOC108361179 [Rhagoletis zephyria]|uniref:uncharacterized protein LOC108361179 n=1 Tax=Rhagoletis zephyria TaxID=28612 RepID=UPI000811266D|nr:PREDICTED: uncharacterized protein LOC108361179 [Rhagoletis zephyria]
MAELNWRSAAVNAIKRIHARVCEASCETHDVFQLEHELKSLETHFQRFTLNHDHLVGQATKDEVAPHDALWEAIEALYDDACCRLNRLIASTKSVPAAASTDHVLNTHSALLDGRSVDLKIDPLVIPVFDGRMCNWLAFKDAFETLVHKSSYPEAFKLGKLRQSVNSKEVPLIGGVYSGGYEEVWRALKDRYDNKKQLAEIHVTRFLNLKLSTEESAKSLLAIVDTVHESLRALRVMEVPVDKWDALAVPIVTSKLPTITKRDWSMRCSSHEIPLLEDLLKFLEKRAHSLCQETSIESVRLPRTVKSNVVSTVDGKCAHCHGIHRITRCPTLAAMSPGARFEAVKGSKLCYNCLRAGHSSKQCSSGGCRNCGRQHNTLFCRESQTGVAASGSQSSSKVIEATPQAVQPAPNL